jgi:hypothetical protein
MIGRLKVPLCLFLITFFFTGCVAVKIDSNVNPNIDFNVSKIYITTRGSTGSKDFMKAITSYMKVELYKYGVQCSYHYFDPLSLQDDDLTEKINDYAPDLIMSIVQTERRISSGYVSTETGTTLDIKLFALDQSNPVWRGSLKADANFGIESASQSAAVKIVERLRSDRVIK